MMQSTNQKCNILQSIFGVFLHSCSTPQRVIQSLARMGVSISSATILRAIKSLSAETYETLRSMGQSLIVSYTYDNFDIDFKTGQPTVEKSATTLTHMTSGTLTYLDHGVRPDDLKCSAALWEKSPLNPKIAVEDLSAPRTYFDFIKLHPEKPHSTGLTRRERFQAWAFLNDLCQHGSNYFAQFQSVGEGQNLTLSRQVIFGGSYSITPRTVSSPIHRSSKSTTIVIPTSHAIFSYLV